MIKSNRGVALGTLVVAVLVMLTITGTITYTSLDTMRLRNLDAMYNDIMLLNQKIEKYYLDNNQLPVVESAIHKNVLINEESPIIPEDILNPNDGVYYYVIDLSKLNGVTLKYGKKYNVENVINEKDVYIINEDTRTIYYLDGIEFELEDGTEIKKYTLEEKYSDVINQNIPIPQGFYYVGGNIKEGFVISDDSADEEKGVNSPDLEGNQFVWIPVNNYNDFKTYNWNTEELKKKPDELYGNSMHNLSDEELKEREELEKSIKTYGGFYIGRYEAGYNGSETISKYKDYNEDNDYKVDGFKCLAETFEVAKEHKDMYQNDESKKVVSTLCYGEQWDAVLTYLSDVIVDGKSYILYKGQQEIDVAKNIYNIHRGVFEWTMEIPMEGLRVIRGTATDKYGYDNKQATWRIDENELNFNDNTYPTGFRVALYIEIPNNPGDSTLSDGSGEGTLPDNPGDITLPDNSGDSTLPDNPGDSTLPNEYQQLEYLEASGKQYLEIDFVANQDTRTIVEYQITNTEADAGMLFGSRTSVYSNFYGLNWGGSKPWRYYNSYGSGNIINTAVIDKEIHIAHKDKNKLYIDDVLINTQAETTFTTPHNMIIFACNTNGTIKNWSSARIYSLKFYDNDTLMVDLIPCYRKSDNEKGMYDIVNNKFYTNLGEGEFVDIN